jgi:hypothetical protein
MLRPLDAASDILPPTTETNQAKGGPPPRRALPLKLLRQPHHPSTSSITSHHSRIVEDVPLAMASCPAESLGQLVGRYLVKDPRPARPPANSASVRCPFPTAAIYFIGMIAFADTCLGRPLATSRIPSLPPSTVAPVHPRPWASQSFGRDSPRRVADLRFGPLLLY